MDDARRDQVELENLLTNGDRVAGVVPSAVAGDDVRLSGEQIGDAAFTFVAPLGTDDHVERHEAPPRGVYHRGGDWAPGHWGGRGVYLCFEALKGSGVGIRHLSARVHNYLKMKQDQRG